MSYLFTDWEVLDIVKNLFPEKKIIDHIYWIKKDNRYIQINTPIEDANIHYEYYRGHVELHFEGDDNENQYQELIDYLLQKTDKNEHLEWTDRGWVYCCFNVNQIRNKEELSNTIVPFVRYFDNLIVDFYADKSSGPSQQLAIVDLFKTQKDVVDVKNLTLRDVLQLPLSIPTYQRIYCWEENNVNILLDDLFSHYENKNETCAYRLGTIILHYYQGKYDIIDGQQRLVTLSLLLKEVGVSPCLLQQKFSSKLSLKYIAYNKFLIKSFCKKNRKYSQKIANFLLEQIDFSVLVLRNSSLDLAYTFFSNQNSRGVELTDYDLLKAHHLRFIPQSFELQAKRYAETWNNMIEKAHSQLNESEDKQYNDEVDYIKTLDTYLYRLRKWTRKHPCDDDSVKYRIKQEYEAAPIIDEIAPFGEGFIFSEPIQGGSHFFAYVERHLHKYHQFRSSEEYTVLHSTIDGGSDQWYRDVVEALLFGYYLKFGNDFLTDALAAILRIILQHRYDKSRANKASIDQWAMESEIIMMINQATSPTFFLAEANRFARNLNYPLLQKMYPIQKRMKRKACEITRQLEKNFSINSFKALNR